MNPSTFQPSRRRILVGSLAAVSGILVADPLAAVEPKQPCLRFAHLTDMHVKPEHGSPAGYAKALQSLNDIKPAPEFLIIGGDHVMDSLEATRKRTDLQWDTYQKVFADNTKLKSYSVLGNHDVWGWCAKENWDDQPGFGKTLALDRLKMDKSYYSFDAGGWHFVMLDNVQRREKAYFGDLDAPQLEWLKADLAANDSKKPVCVISHIPIVSVCAMFFGYGEKNDKTPKQFWHITDNLLHRDSKPLIKLLAANNVKLAISGHIHLLDRIEYLGINFVCDGAVSGAWWGGPMQETAEGYGVFDLYPDGTFDHQYISYGWTPPNA